MRGAELFVRCLENEGVDYIFGIPGEENLDVMDALLDSRIRFITTRQVGPLQQPPFSAPYGSHKPLPITSCEACVVKVLKPLAFKSSTELTLMSGSDMMLPDQIPGLNGPKLRPIRSGYVTPPAGSS